MASQAALALASVSLTRYMVTVGVVCVARDCSRQEML